MTESLSTTLLALFALLCAHYVADFAMQNQYVADAKAKVHTAPDGIHALLAHAVHHVAASALALALLGLPWLIPALAVGVTHLFIDYAKAVRGWITYHQDQILHLSVAVAAALAIGVFA